MENLVPRGEFVVIKPHHTERERDGLIISNKTTITTQGTVVGVSKEVNDLFVGQTIIYIPNRNVEVNSGGEKLLFVHQEDVLAVHEN